MRFVRFLLLAAIFVSLGSAAYSQGYGDKPMANSASADVTSTLKALELKVNEAFKNGDSKAFFSIVDPSAWMADGMGINPVTEIPSMFKDVVIKNYTIEGYKVMTIDDGTCVATYTWKGEGTYKGEAFPPVSYCSTVWAKRGKEWKALFHQESFAMGAMEPPAAGAH